MNLQGRNLEPNLRGDDVELLQAELKRLKLKTNIVDVDGFFGSTTFMAVKELQERVGLPATGIVDAATAQRINREVDENELERFVVRGDVRHADGRPMPRVSVRVERKGLRENERLGQATTNAAGAYSVEYAPETRPVSIIAHALGSGDEILVSSPVICRARPLEVVNLTPDGVFRGPSELELLEEKLAPILRRENVRIEQLNATDIEWLSCAHGFNAVNVAYWVASARMAGEAVSPAPSTEAFYALVRQKLPTSLLALVAERREVLLRALETSVTTNVVRANIREQIPAVLRMLREQIVHLALRESSTDRATFRALLDIVELPLERQRRLLADYVDRTGTVAEFWESQRAQGVPDDELDAIEYTVRAAAIALNHLPLTRELARMRSSGELGRELRELARFRRDDWQRLIGRNVHGARVGAPAVFGEEEAPREQRYATFLERFVETLFPTPTLTHRLAELDETRFAPTLAFLRRNPNFEFRRQPITEFLREHPHALDGIEDQAAARSQLGAVQRLMNVAPEFEKARTVALIGSGIESALAIRRMGPVQFLRLHAEGLGGVAPAQQVYTNAARQADTAMVLLSQSVAFSPTPLPIIPVKPFGPGIPALEDLFGSLDLCECEQCQSVYSPAAYLVDLLHFLMNRSSRVPHETALDVLFLRRPDIGEIDLNCSNTNTELPHVDLVLEILENAVAPGGGFPFQTEGDTDTLAANPEHVFPAAYTVLATEAVYPWDLPFDLWAAEARSYLAELGVERHVLMQHFRREGVAPELIHIASEYLGLTPRERAIVTGAQGVPPTRAMWGLDATAFAEFSTSRRVSEVLERSRLSYDELVELLEVPFVDPNATLAIHFAGADCNLETATVTALSGPALDRIHRFVRLQRKVGWSMRDLGRALSLLANDTLNDHALLQLAGVKRLRGALDAPFETLFTWWSPMLDTQGQAGERSLFDRVFHDPTLNPAALEIFELNEQRSDLGNPSRALEAHASVVAMVLGIQATDVALLLPELANGHLNLANLTQLYKVATSTRAAKLSIADYVRWRGFGDVNPFESVELTESFVEQVRLVKASGFDFATLDYLLRHRLPLQSPLSDAAVSLFLGKLRGGFGQIRAGHEFAADPIGTRTAELLAKVIPADVLARALSLVAGTSTEDVATRTALLTEHFQAFLDPAEATTALVSPGLLTSPAERFAFVLGQLLAHLSRLASETLVVESLAAALRLDSSVVALLRELVPSVADPTASILSVFLAEPFAAEPAEPAELPTNSEFPDQFAAFHRVAKIAIVINALELSSDVEAVEFLIARGATVGWLNLNALPLERQGSAGDGFERWSRMVRLFRAAVSLPLGIAGLFDMFEELADPELSRSVFLDRLAERTGLDRSNLDFLTGPDGLALAFPSDFRDGAFLVQLNECFKLLLPLGVNAGEAWSWAAPPSNTDVAQTVARAIKQAVRAKFNDQKLWLAAAKPIRDELREQQRAALVAHVVHSTVVALPNFETPLPTLRFRDERPAVEELQLRLNAAGAEPSLDVDGQFGPLTRSAVIDFQSNHSLAPDGIVGPLTWAVLNQLRSRLRGPNDLYAHFLVDVEMSPCMLTSRIVLATNAVQLFVQRCLLNLEPLVELTPEDAKEWEWMKFFQVWVANRKIFLYPENWIEPELRDDKTPLFVDLERGLLQDEATEATVEREYLKYLEQLDRVAHLEISAVHREWEEDRDILHVFGRTRNTPHLYYYRQWVDQRSWTPWRKVEADIDGDHLVATIWNRRLYLFWPMFVEEAEQVVQGGLTADPEPMRFYRIQMAWSEFFHDKWSPRHVVQFPKVSPPRPDDQSVVTTARKLLPPKSAFSFWTELGSDGSLSIVMHDRNAQAHAEALSKKFVVFCMAGNATERFAPIEGWDELSADFNVLLETGVNEFDDSPLKVITQGLVTGNGVLQLVDTKKATVLQATPHTYSLILPQNDRPFFCRSPFFFQDQARTFLIVPHGIYVGGPSAGFDDLTLVPGDTPLELPDSTLSHASHLLGLESAHSASESSSIDQPASPTSIAAIVAILQPQTASQSLAASWEARTFTFSTFYHPYTTLLIEQLNRYGIDGVLRPDPEQAPPQRRQVVKELQRQLKDEAFFDAEYQPNPDNVINVLGMTQAQRKGAGPLDEFDFSYPGAYSVYNWEVFFHAPFMLAKRLSANQRFAEAQRWFHYIFEPLRAPTAGEPWPLCVWRIKPFVEHGMGSSIAQSMLLLKSTGLSSAELAERKSLRDQIEAWRKDPFKPHLIARMRVEPYMKAVVMAYLDNLIAWGDHLFRQDTRETINEATQLYILASELLGERPQEIAAHEGTRKVIDGEEVRTFNQLRSHLDAFSNVLVELETAIQPTAGTQPTNLGAVLGLSGFGLSANVASGPGDVAPFTNFSAPGHEPPDNDGAVTDLAVANPVPPVLGPTLFFCIPKNDELLRYWDSVADRLFKIRHCLNIEGVARKLSLFAPPIDPALLVKAAAAGVDLGSVLSDLNAPPPRYRFQVLAARSIELINDVKNLGANLLAALEKKDAEELALLRSTHELRLLEAIRELKKRQIEEAVRSRDALQESERVVQQRQTYYASRLYKSPKEEEHLEKLEEGFDLHLKSQGIETARAAFGFLPDFDIGIEGAMSSPTVKARWGGSNLLSYMSAISQTFAMGALAANHQASKALTEAGYERRRDDWDFQHAQATLELSQIEKQLAAADVRIELAEHDLENQELQLENAKATDEYFRSKYTNQVLYAFMVSQISATYFQSYQLAYDMAKRAERAFRHELGLEDSSFIQFGYWDSQKKGLLAGEKLQTDLRRMESAYLEQNRREREITQHFSLALLDPAALLELRETGSCEFAVPELAFDIAYPGHFLRRIKSLALTIPCVAGPYTNVGATLTLLQNRVRVTPLLEDGELRQDLIGIEAISTSSAQSDPGLFQVNFGDERYLPFEGAGAISRFRVSLPTAFRSFDYDTIADVVLHMSYTARDGGEAFRQQVDQRVLETINNWLDEVAADGTGLQHLLSLRREFPNDLHRLLSPVEGQNQAAELRIGKRHFPHFLRTHELTTSSVLFVLKLRDGETLVTAGLTLALNETAGSAFAVVPNFGSLQASQVSFSQSIGTTEMQWRLEVTSGSLPAESLQDIYLLITYQVEPA